MTKIQTKVTFSTRLPSFKKLSGGGRPEHFFFIVDQKVLKANEKLRRWLKPMPFVYAVRAGEELKDLKQFPQHLENIFRRLDTHAHRHLTLVAVGGGSVGDFSGFVASIFKRGIRFLQMPTSWLAAIDSAHGGKNGLNIGPLKNQIGTFYDPQEVWVIEDLLTSQSQTQLHDALGELYKMSLLTSKKWGPQLQKKSSLSPQDLWEYLPMAIAEKYFIVKRDPRETKGLRHWLNLGHTFGHVLELTQKLPHGTSVALGLKLALDFSHDQGFLAPKEYRQLQDTSMYGFLESIPLEPVPSKEFQKILLQDKKKTSDQKISFVFLEGQGKPKTKSMDIQSLLQAGKKHGFIK